MTQKFLATPLMYVHVIDMEKRKYLPIPQEKLKIKNTEIQTIDNYMNIKKSTVIDERSY